MHDESHIRKRLLHRPVSLLPTVRLRSITTARQSPPVSHTLRPPTAASSASRVRNEVADDGATPLICTTPHALRSDDDGRSYPSSASTSDTEHPTHPTLPTPAITPAQQTGSCKQYSLGVSATVLYCGPRKPTSGCSSSICTRACQSGNLNAHHRERDRERSDGHATIIYRRRQRYQCASSSSQAVQDEP